jgi:hypothetical protein
MASRGGAFGALLFGGGPGLTWFDVAPLLAPEWAGPSRVRLSACCKNWPWRVGDDCDAARLREPKEGWVDGDPLEDVGRTEGLPGAAVAERIGDGGPERSRTSSSTLSALPNSRTSDSSCRREIIASTPAKEPSGWTLSSSLSQLVSELDGREASRVNLLAPSLVWSP